MFILPTTIHLYPPQAVNCCRNSRLMVDEEGNGEFRLESLKGLDGITGKLLTYVITVILPIKWEITIFVLNVQSSDCSVFALSWRLYNYILLAIISTLFTTRSVVGLCHSYTTIAIHSYRIRCVEKYNKRHIAFCRICFFTEKKPMIIIQYNIM